MWKYKQQILFATGIFSIIGGFYAIYLEHATRYWLATDAQVVSLMPLEKEWNGPYGPNQDRFQLTVSYRVQSHAVKATINDYGHPSYKINDKISVKIDPDNPQHFVFNKPNAGGSIAMLFLIGIIMCSVSFLLTRSRANRDRISF